MEYKIGEIFELGCEWYQCMEQPEKYDKTVCDLCAFQGNENCELDRCSGTYRSDKKSVIFKKLEKVGEPFTIVGKLYQHYKVFDIDNVCGDGFWCVHNYKAKTLTIEIKQNKEYMEEYRMHDAKEDIPEFDKVVDECLFGEDKLNLKPFDLEAAKAGKTVCTRDGRKARIICFDIEDKDNPIAAAIHIGECESVYLYTNRGEYNKGKEDELDLMMLPEKKEGWVNIDKGGSGKITISSPFSTKEEAIHNDNETTIDTIKISWEE